MTINASKMRELVLAHRKAEEEKTKAVHDKYIAETVEPTIRKTAEAGGCQTYFNYVGMHIDFDRVSKELIENGFTATITFNPTRLVVSW